jgi:hypothetical protein
MGLTWTEVAKIAPISIISVRITVSEAFFTPIAASPNHPNTTTSIP